MNDLDKKLKELEDKIVKERSRKKQLREKVQKREAAINEKIIDNWNKEVLKNEKFQANLDTILKKFKEINPNNNYTYLIYESDISKKENIKDQVAVYLDGAKVSLQLELNGIYSRVATAWEEFDVNDIKRAKEEFLNGILEIFKEQNYA